MGCGYEAAMRIRQGHVSGLKKHPKKNLLPENATPKKKSPKTEGNGSPRRSPRLHVKEQPSIQQIDWSKIIVPGGNEVTVMVAGRSMKLRVMPENEQEKKEDKKDDNFVAETSDSDTKSKPEMTVEETESEKEEKLPGRKSELITKGMERIELMNTFTQDDLSVSDTSADVSQEKSKELLPGEEELLSGKGQNGGITSEEEEKQSVTDEGLETDRNETNEKENDDSTGYPSEDLSDKDSQIQTEDNLFEGGSERTGYNENKDDTLTSIQSSREEGQFDSADISNAGGFL